MSAGGVGGGITETYEQRPCHHRFNPLVLRRVGVRGRCVIWKALSKSIPTAVDGGKLCVKRGLAQVGLWHV